MNIEYEYSFKVNSLEPFFDYCKDNGFTQTDRFEQIRTIYKNNNNTIARTTVKKYENTQEKWLDFKQDHEVGATVLKELRESSPLQYWDETAVDSILEFLGYQKHITTLRTRTVYEKDGAIFEFDEFTSPEVAKVVSVEGEKELVDRIYNEIKDIEN